jgi:hypothetical protein
MKCSSRFFKHTYIEIICIQCRRPLPNSAFILQGLINGVYEVLHTLISKYLVIRETGFTLCWIWDSYFGYYDSALGRNILQLGDSLKFRKNISLPCSGSNIEPSKKAAKSLQSFFQARTGLCQSAFSTSSAWYLLQLLTCSTYSSTWNYADMFLRNVWTSPTALSITKKFKLLCLNYNSKLIHNWQTFRQQSVMPHTETGRETAYLTTLYRLFQKELYNGIPNVTVWRVSISLLGQVVYFCRIASMWILRWTGGLGCIFLLFCALCVLWVRWVWIPSQCV